MAAMGIFGGGLAAYKLFKTAKTAIKGYRETKAEKKDNQDNGVYIDLKTWDDDAGKITTTPTLIAKAGTSAANMSNDERDKKQKEEQKKLDPENARKAAEWEIKNKEKEKSDKEASDAKKAASDAEKGVGDWVGEPIDDIPADMVSDVKEKERRAIGGHKDVLAYKDRWGMKPEASIKGWKKWVQNPEKPKDFEYLSTADYDKRKKERQGRNESRILTFGKFISEDVMKDLKLATKSKKDSEITLDDGADIPIDPLTASILVKYIEGLGSSEKNKTINKIQRTERAFMKVLGQAHGE